MRLDLWEGTGLSFKDLLIKRKNDRFLTNAFFILYYQEWKVYLLFFALFMAATSAAPTCKCEDEAKVKVKIDIN